MSGTETSASRSRTDVEKIERGAPLTNGYDERWRRLRPGGQDPDSRDLIRTDPDRPCPTILKLGGASNRSSVCHPDEPRKFSVAELKRLSGFPDDFVLAGSYQQQYERLGNAVPPPMALAVACALRDVLSS